MHKPEGAQQPSNVAQADALSTLLQRYRLVRKQSLALTEALSSEDMQAQSMPDASPIKWHLAHTTWFFETFILQAYQSSFVAFDVHFSRLFNSYYESVGPRHARPQRGLLTRPSLARVMAYRHWVDAAIDALLLAPNDAWAPSHVERLTFLITVGLHHEMQHQELISTDLLHLLWHNPTFPAAYATAQKPPVAPALNALAAQSLSFTAFEGGLVEVGASEALAQTAQGFAYDCECPKHRVYLPPFLLADRLVSNADWLAFMADGGYQNHLLWLSDGWQCAQQNGWEAPLYWLKQEGQYYQFGLDGLQAIDLQAPVCHISYFEADAFARWAGKRLPKEHEWEMAARQISIAGNFLEEGQYRAQPLNAALAHSAGVHQLYGDVWEWTQSAFLPYPGFKAEQGALGEYNGKFMSNQYVLRGGSCVTPKAQLRDTYRTFFYPHHRWQFTGLRLAEYQ